MTTLPTRLGIARDIAPAWRDRIGLLWPGDVRVFMPARVVVLLLLAGAGAGVLRLAADAPFDTVWAEDGSVFLSDAESRSTVDAVLLPYAGYLHLVPRLLAELAALLPIGWAPAALTVSAALVVAAVALVVYRVTAPHIRSTPVRVVVAAYIALLPVGREVVGNIANLHWFLLVAALCVLLWDPGTRAGLVLGAVVLIATATSSPFAVLLLPLALLRLAIVRGRSGWVPFAALASGVLVQVAAMLSAPERVLNPETNPVRIGVWYVGHVLAPALFGEVLVGESKTVTVRMLALGLVTCAALVLLILATRRAELGRVRPFAATCALGSVALYVVMVGSSGIATGRYTVPPVLLLVLAVAAVFDALLSTRMHPACLPGRPRVATSALALFLAVLAIGWAVSLPIFGGRDDSVRWSSELRTATSSCPGEDLSGSSQRAATATLPISPPGWSMTLPCRAVPDR